jgi:hypothetical protein
MSLQAQPAHALPRLSRVVAHCSWRGGVSVGPMLDEMHSMHTEHVRHLQRSASALQVLQAQLKVKGAARKHILHPATVCHATASYKRRFMLQRSPQRLQRSTRRHHASNHDPAAHLCKRDACIRGPSKATILGTSIEPSGCSNKRHFLSRRLYLPCARSRFICRNKMAFSRC